MIILKLQGNQKENFINFWEFLELPMNSPIGDIKIAFASKFEKIKILLIEEKTIIFQKI